MSLPIPILLLIFPKLISIRSRSFDFSQPIAYLNTFTISLTIFQGTHAVEYQIIKRKVEGGLQPPKRFLIEQENLWQLPLRFVRDIY